MLAGSYDPGPVTTQRVAAQLRWVERFVEQTTGNVSRAILEDLHQLASYEIAFGERLLRGTVLLDLVYVKPGPEQLAALVEELPYQGQTLAEHVSDYAAWQFREVATTVQRGVVMGRTLDQITRDVLGTASLNFNDGAYTGRAARAQAEQLVRTSVNHVATQAREELWRENADIVKAVEFVATLDSKTTIACSSLDASIWPIGSGPRPPIHPNCRSTTAPVLKSLQELAPELKAKVSNVPEERARLDGVASGRVAYEAWLRRQPQTMQDLVLGPARAKLWRSDPTATLSRLVDRQGRPLTLAQLAEREADLLLNLSRDDLEAMARWIGDARARRLLKRKAAG